MGKFIVKFRHLILILALVALVPSFIGMMLTRVNYDMLSYLPDSMETIIGQNELLKDFGKGAFSMLVTEGMTVRELCQVPVFWLSLILMVCAGASELSMAQWASAYTEAALGFSKSVGDLVGPCLFAVTMGASRVIYGKYGPKMDLTKYIIGSGILCLACYLLASLSSNPVLGLTGCIFCGFSVGIMWPGTISITSPRLPRGGTALFALLAMAGDLGGSAGPSLVGFVTQQAGDNLQAGMLAGLIFPLVLVISMILMIRRSREG